MNIQEYSDYVNKLINMKNTCEYWTSAPKAWICDFLLLGGASCERVLGTMGKDAHNLIISEKGNGRFYVNDLVTDLYIKYCDFHFSISAYLLVISVFAEVNDVRADIDISSIEDEMYDHAENALTTQIFKNTLNDRKKYTEGHAFFLMAEKQFKNKDWRSAWTNYFKAYELFKPIRHYRDSEQLFLKCNELYLLSKKNTKFEEAEDAFSKASSISDYENAARLFSEIAEFSDAKIKRDQCFKCVKEIQIEQQYQEILNSKTLAEKETDINKKASRYQGMISAFDKNLLSEKAKILLEQCKSSHNECLKQIEEHRMQELLNKASAQFEEADKVSDNASRAVALSKVLDEYKDYAENKKFAQLLCDCRDKLKMANDSIAYDAAVVLMNKAEKECEYTDAAAAFSVLSGFKDSDEKKAMCVSRAEECKKRESYHKAIESINRSKEITLFNWRKYR